MTKTTKVKCMTGRCKNRTTYTTNANGICDRHPKKTTTKYEAAKIQTEEE